MSETIEKGVSRLPTGLSGALAGFVVGYLVDKIVAHLYVTYVPEKDRPSLPICNLDDWILIVISLVLMFKRRDFGAGFFFGVVLGSKGII